jgi:hypothetical protein
MPLTRFGFIVTGAGLDPDRHRQHLRSDAFEMVTVGVTSPAQALPVACELVAEGIQLIELCGGFGPVWTARIIEAIGDRIPVGSVAYGPEAVDRLHALFAPATP